MSLILNIDTALETACISIAKEGNILEQAINNEQKEHGTFLQTAIQLLLKKLGIHIKELDAIALNAGPGSYTGLRVGMASAKGLCYALNKPLITVGSLELLAYQAIIETDKKLLQHKLFCCMIDARRMEVFTAIYDGDLNVILPPSAIVLVEDSYANYMLKNTLIFFGNGSEKWHLLCNNKNADFISLHINSLYLNSLSYKKFKSKEFVDLAYVEPLYIKEFYNKL